MPDTIEVTSPLTVDTSDASAGTYTTSNGGIVDQGTDTVPGGETLQGTDGNDIIVGGKGNDTIVQNVGDGDDTLIGGQVFTNASDKIHVNGAGSNNYVFNFNVTTTQGVDLTFRDGDTPNYTANLQAWNNYQAQLEAWREALIQQYGADSDTSTQSTDVYTSATKSKPSTFVTTETYDNTFHIAGETTIQGDGNDTVLGFDTDDKITLAGLSSAGITDLTTLLAHGTITTDANGDTTIAIGDSSIKILGQDTAFVESHLYFA